MPKHYVAYTDTSKKRKITESENLEEVLEYMRTDELMGAVYEYDIEPNDVTVDGRIALSESFLENETLVHLFLTGNLWQYKKPQGQPTTTK